MPKLTYKPISPDDPSSTQVGSTRFESSKAVEVDDATYERLSKNPYFSGDKKARERAENASFGGEGASRDSAINLAPPPGSGMKSDPGGLVATADGLVPAEDASLVDGANTVDDEGDEPKRRGRPPKSA